MAVMARRRHSWKLSTQSQPIGHLTFPSQSGEVVTINQWLDNSYTDGFLVIHHGQVVFERYFNGMQRDTLHLSQSIAKSITATVAGILIGRGLLDSDCPIEHYLPELKRTAWRGASLQQVLDMTTGVRYVEDYEDPDADIAITEVASGWKPGVPEKEYPSCIWQQILDLTTAVRPHGQRFVYRSIETDVLAHCMERVTGTRLAELVSRELWKPMGAGRDASFTVDRAGFALADGGFNATLRDYARFGLLHLNQGANDRGQVVPRKWIHDILNAQPGRLDQPHISISPQGAYRNHFWVHDITNGIYMARGIFGQIIYIDRSHDMVAVKLSSWPEFTSVPRLVDTLTALARVGEALNGSRI